MDSDLLSKALNFHGQELSRAIEDEQGQESLRVVDMRNIDYHEYRKRAKDFGFQDRQRRQKMLRFIAKKADMIYKPAEEVEKLVFTDAESDELCAVMPPLESFMGVPAPERKRHLFELLEVNDVVIGQVVRKQDLLLTLNLICFDCGKKREIMDLGLKMFLHNANIPPVISYDSSFETLQANDYFRAVVISLPHVSTNTGKISLTLRPEALLPAYKSLKLGPITEEEIPSHHRRYIINQGKPYSEILEHTLGFNNPATSSHLSKSLGIPESETFSYIRALQRLKSSKEDSALELRKQQSSKWAYKSVRDGVSFFKAGNHTEAFQCLNKALQIDPRNVEALVARGALFANNNNLRRALEDFEEALEINPNHLNGRKYTSETLVALGKYYEERSEMDAAYKTYKKAVQINSNNMAAREAFSTLELKEKKHQQEKELLAQQSIEEVQTKVDTRDKLKLLLKAEKKTKNTQFRGDSESSSPSRSWSSDTPPARKSRSDEREEILDSPARRREFLLNRPREKESYNRSRSREKETMEGESSGYWRDEKKVVPHPTEVYDDYERRFQEFEKKLSKPLAAKEEKYKPPVMKEDKYKPIAKEDKYKQPVMKEEKYKQPAIKEEKYYKEQMASPKEFVDDKLPKAQKKRKFSEGSRSPSPAPKKEPSLRERIKMFYEKHINLEDKGDKAPPRKNIRRDENIRSDENIRRDENPRRDENIRRDENTRRDDSPFKGSKSKWDYSDEEESTESKKFSHKRGVDDEKRQVKGRQTSLERRPASPKVVFVMRKDEDLHYSKIYTHSAFKDEDDDEEKKKGEDKAEPKKTESDSQKVEKKPAPFKEVKKEKSRKERSYRRASSSSDDSSDRSSSSSSSLRSGSSRDRRRKTKREDDSPYFEKRRKSYDDHDRYDKTDKYYDDRNKFHDKYKDKYHDDKYSDDKYHDDKYRDYKKPYPYFNKRFNHNHRGGGYRGNFRRPVRGRYFRGRRPFFNRRSPHRYTERNNNKRIGSGDEDVVISRAPDIEELKRLKERKKERDERDGSSENDIPKLTKLAVSKNWESEHSTGKRSLVAAKAAADKINETLNADGTEDNGNGKGKESLKEMESFLEKLKSQKSK